MENKNQLNQCKTCFMELPDEHIHDDECIFCNSYQKKWSVRDYETKKIELRKILNFYKEKHKNDRYDCLIPLSGGKDSTYVLYLAVKEFDMRPLTVTFNNGLQTQLARNNIDNAVRKLAVDHITIAPNKQELQAMYSHCFKNTRNMCMVCNHIINTTVLQVAEKEAISLILVGGVSKLELAPIYGNKRYCMEEVFKSVIADGMDFDISKYLNKPIRQRSNIEFITLFNYYDYDYNEVLRILKNELLWSESHHGDTKIDCEFHPVISHFKYLNNGVSSSILMSSALLRDKKITLDEYKSRIERIKKQLSDTDTEDIKEFYKYLEFNENDSSPAKHVLDYVNPVLNEEDFLELEELKKSGKNIESLIEKLIEIVQPEIKRDGGVLKFADFKNNELIVELSGHCRSCLQADDTMIPYIESLAKKFVSEDISVERYIRLE